MLTPAQRVADLRHRYHAANLAMGPGPVAASPAMWLSETANVGEYQYVEQDESIVRDATQRLTFVHRVDRSPEVDDWTIEELLFELDHLDDGSSFKSHMILRMRRQVEYEAQREPIEYVPSLEETWG